MTRLRHGEIAAFSTALETLYGSVEMATLAERVTRCLHGLFPCEAATFDLIDLSSVQWNMLVVSPLPSDLNGLLAALQVHGHEHPIVSHAARHQDPHATRFSDLISLREFRQTGIYHELFRPHAERMDRQLGFVAKPSETLAFGASVSRRGRDFTVEERTQLELLRPHLLQAHRLARANELILERERSARERAVVGGGLCQIGPEGEMAGKTAAVEPLLTRYFPDWRGSRDFLPGPVLVVLRTVLGKGWTRVEELPALGRTWYFPRAFGTLKVHLASGDAAGRWQLLLTEEPADPSVAELAARHAISRREAETLYWIGQGKTNGEIGTILGISGRTVHKHAEHLYLKLGVDNRAGAVRVALGR